MDLITISAIAIPASLAIASLIKDYSADSVTVGTRFMIPYRVPLDRHLCILGPTRGGKSSLVRAMVRRLSRKYVVTILDWHGEYSGILPTIPTSAIKMDLEKIPPKLLTEILGFGLGLNEPSMYMLYRMIRDGNYSSFDDLINRINNYLVDTRTEAEMKAAILRRLEYSASNIGKGIIDIDKVMEGDSVIDLSDLTLIEEKRLVSSLILASLYIHYMKRGLIEKGVKHILIIEEAQNLLDMGGSNYSIIDHVIMELAKYGLRTILVSNTIPRSSLLKHCNIVLFKVSPEILGDEIALSRDLAEKLSTLLPDEAVVITNKGIVKIRPLRASLSPNHIVIRGFRGIKHEVSPGEIDKGHVIDLDKNHVDVHERAESNISVNGNDKVLNSVNNDGSNALNVDTNVDNKRTVRNNQYQVKNFNGVSLINTVSSDGSLFRKQIMELEREVVNLKDRIDEIERILEADEKMIERILELDDKLKKQ